MASRAARSTLPDASVALRGAVGCNAISTLALTEKLAAIGIDPLPNGLELFRFDYTREAEDLGTTSVPLSDDALIFGVIVAVLQVPR